MSMNTSFVNPVIYTYTQVPTAPPPPPYWITAQLLDEYGNAQNNFVDTNS